MTISQILAMVGGILFVGIFITMEFCIIVQLFFENATKEINKKLDMLLGQKTGSEKPQLSEPAEEVLTETIQEDSRAKR